MKDQIELYEDNCPTELAESQLITDAIFDIIKALKKTQPVSDIAIDVRNLVFGESIVQAIQEAVEEYEEEFNSDLAFETQTELDKEAGFGRGE